jgi:hypothetical protein
MIGQVSGVGRNLGTRKQFNTIQNAKPVPGQNFNSGMAILGMRDIDSGQLPRL